MENNGTETEREGLKHEKSCGAICFTRADGTLRVLVICNRYGGHWAFPKGHVEQGESEADTALREVFEETGARIRLLPGFREVTTYSPAKGVVKDVVFFLAELTGGALRPQPGEVRTVRLLSPEEALSRLTYAADRALLERALEFLDGRPLESGETPDETEARS